MATQKPTETLFIQRAAVANGVQLTAGELSAEQREQLGEARVASLQQTGYLKTQAQLDEEAAAEEERKRLAPQDPHAVNPNYGTPSMTPEAAEKFDAPELGRGVRGGEVPDANVGNVGNARGDWESTPLSAIGLQGRTLNALQAAGLVTVGDLVTYGDENDGLQSIEGVGEATEEEIKAAVKKAQR